MKKIKAIAPENCDLCKDTLRRFDTFYDGRLQGRSQWAWLCAECWQQYGAGLGTGTGQEYDSTSNEKIRG